MNIVHYWRLHYRIEYPSGKVWKDKQVISGDTRGQAEMNLEWLLNGRNGKVIITDAQYLGITKPKSDI